jgi:hypothetical protein
MHGGQSCCFHQVVAALPFSNSSVLSASPPARWGNSVLNAALCPRDKLWDLPSALFWEVGLLSHPCSQPLYFSWSLLETRGSFGRLTCHPTPALIFYASSDLCWVPAAPLRGWLVAPPPISAFAALPVFVHWEFSAESLAPCPTPLLCCRFSVPPSPLLSVLDYN